MGCSLCKRINVVFPAEDRDAPHETVPEGESVRAVSVKCEDPTWTHGTVNLGVPDTFHPKVLENISEEKQCKLTRSKISSRHSEKHVRSRIKETFNAWGRGKILQQIENHALAISAESTVSAEILAMNLTSSQANYVKILSTSDGNTSLFDLQIAKTYAIYFWIANNILFCKDMWKRYITTDSEVKSNAKAVLQKRKCLSQGYAKLFHSVATAAGLTSHIIKGNIQLSQSDSFEEHMTVFERSKLNEHWWNVVSERIECCIMQVPIMCMWLVSTHECYIS